MAAHVDPLRLFHSKTSVCSQKVRLVLAELGQDWHGIELNLAKGEQFDNAYLEFNPNGTVPTLIDGKSVIRESNEAMVHLCSKSGGKTLFPESPEKQQAIKKWMALSSEFHFAVYTLTTLAMNRDKYLSLSEDKLEERIAKIPNTHKANLLRDTVKIGIGGHAVNSAASTTAGILEKLESALTDNRYLCGTTLSLADFSILPFICRLDFLSLVSRDCKINHRNLFRWKNRMTELPGYETAVLHFHSDETLARYRENGSVTRYGLQKNGLSF